MANRTYVRSFLFFVLYCGRDNLVLLNNSDSGMKCLAFVFNLPSKLGSNNNKFVPSVLTSIFLCIT